MTVAPALQCRTLWVDYGRGAVLRGLTFQVQPDQVLAVLGPSGSGKSTLLNTVSGFVHPSAGEVGMFGRRVGWPRGGVPPEDRDVAVVFQHYALWPHLNAVDTVAYPIRRRGVGTREARSQAQVLLDRMGIGHLARRRPAELSGGQQQRVGVARALARQASLYLFDEPTAHLDTALRAALAEELAERRAATGAAAIYATHDAGEALSVADRVAVLRDGRLEQLGSPTEIYEQPVDVWAAQLTGPASLLSVTLNAVHEDKLALTVSTQAVNVRGGCAPGVVEGPAAALVRPDWTSLGGSLPGIVRRVWYRGPHTDYRLDTPAGAVDVRETGRPSVRPLERTTWTLERVWLVDRQPHATTTRLE